VDVDKLSNHVKSVSFSLDFSLFDSIYCSSLSCAVITGCKRDVIIIVMIKCFLLAKSQFSFQNFNFAFKNVCFQKKKKNSRAYDSKMLIFFYMSTQGKRERGFEPVTYEV
jgi:hypothetical protein